MYGSSKYEHRIMELASPSGNCVNLASVARPHLAQNELPAREDDNPGGQPKGAAGFCAQQLPGSMQ